MDVIGANRFLGRRSLSTLVVLLLGSVSAHANGSCNAATTIDLHALERLVDSIRVDKPGLARVYARDGTAFTAGQALWMQGQVREAEAACARGDRADAAQRLTAVQDLLRARSR